MAAPTKCSCRLIRCSFQSLSRNYHVSSINSSKQSVAAVSKETSVPSRKDIVIPPRIKRDPTSILKALSSCVLRDFNGPHYMFMDDPYFIPTNNLDKRAHALSKASGRKAAKYLLKEYPDLFDPITTAVPRIEALSPAKVSYEHNTEDEVALVERIDMRRVSDAVELYNTIKNSGSAVSEETLHSLLDLLCVYNSSDPPEQLEPEEFWFRRDIGQDNSKTIRKSWKEDCTANIVFNDMENKTPSAYCSMIRGCVLYFNTDQAFELYEEMLEKELPVDLSTFNALLSVAGFHRDNYDLKWELVESLLTQMNASNVRPNLDTFNNTLSVLSRMAKFRRAQQLSLKTLNEMKACGIEPSLGTWSYVIQIFYQFPDSNSNILYEIMKELDGKQLTFQGPHDLSFFTSAMSKACLNLRDLDLAYKIDKLLNTGHNVSLLGDASKESAYYSTFMRALLVVEPLDKVMECYEKFVPNIWVPTFPVVDELLQTVELFDGYSYLPLIWSDMTLFNYHKKEDIVVPILRLMAKKRQEPDLQQTFCDIAQNVLERIEEEAASRRITRVQPLRLTCTMLNYIISIHVKGDHLDKAWELIEYYKKHSTSIAGILSEEMFSELTEALIQAQQADRVVSCIVLSSELGYSQASDLAKLAGEKLTDLSEAQRQHLNMMVQ